jgi:CRP-like cAMP-binding protein
VKATATDIEAFFSQFRLVGYHAGEMIFSSLDTPPGVLYLKSGFVRMYSISESGSELTLHIFSSGSHFPMTWALNETPNRHNYQALTDTRVFIAPKQAVAEYFAKNPWWALDFAKRVLLGLDGLTKRIETMAFGSGYHRTVSVLLYLSSHFGEKKGDGIALVHRFTHQDIASLAGMSREHVSLELEKLHKVSYIHYDNRHIIIPHIDILFREFSSSFKK